MASSAPQEWLFGSSSAALICPINSTREEHSDEIPTVEIKHQLHNNIFV